MPKEIRGINIAPPLRGAAIGASSKPSDQSSIAGRMPSIASLMMVQTDLLVLLEDRFSALASSLNPVLAEQGPVNPTSEGGILGITALGGDIERNNMRIRSLLEAVDGVASRLEV